MPFYMYIHNVFGDSKANNSVDWLLTLACVCTAKDYGSWSVCLSVCRFVACFLLNRGCGRYMYQM